MNENSFAVFLQPAGHDGDSLGLALAVFTWGFIKRVQMKRRIAATPEVD